jgi:hypothetical protein
MRACYSSFYITEFEASEPACNILPARLLVGDTGWRELTLFVGPICCGKCTRLSEFKFDSTHHGGQHGANLAPTRSRVMVRGRKHCHPGWDLSVSRLPWDPGGAFARLPGHAGAVLPAASLFGAC